MVELYNVHVPLCTPFFTAVYIVQGLVLQTIYVSTGTPPLTWFSYSLEFHLTRFFFKNLEKNPKGIENLIFFAAKFSAKG